MKVTRAFSPLTITLETQKEKDKLIDWLHDAMKYNDSRWRMCGNAESPRIQEIQDFLRWIDK